MKTFQEFSEKQPNFGEIFEEGMFSSLFSGAQKPKFKYADDPNYRLAFRKIFDQLIAQGVSVSDAPYQADKIIDQKLSTPAGVWELKRIAAQMNVTDDPAKDRGVQKLALTHPETPVTHSGMMANHLKARRIHQIGI
jgi:hypothetical protein